MHIQSRPAEFSYSPNPRSAQTSSPLGADAVDFGADQVSSGVLGYPYEHCTNGATDINSGGDLGPCMGAASDVKSAGIGGDIAGCKASASDVKSGDGISGCGGLADGCFDGSPSEGCWKILFS